MNPAFRWILAGLWGMGVWSLSAQAQTTGVFPYLPSQEERWGYSAPDQKGRRPFPTDQRTETRASSDSRSQGFSSPWGSNVDFQRGEPREPPGPLAPEAPPEFTPFQAWAEGNTAPPLTSPQQSPGNSSSLLLEEDDLRQPIELGQPVPLKPEQWTWLLLPQGLIYRSYLAGVKEPRCGIVFNHDSSYGWIWDIGLGARLGMIRYGSEDPLHPEGIQLDFEGAALLRIDPEEERDVVGCDYRYGFPLTWGSGPIRTKFGYYHLSSHLGDELMLKNPGIYRDNYVRDSLVFGKSLYLTPSLRLYGEAAWAFHVDGRAKPWEFQCGMDFSPLRVGQWGGAPFLALNGHWRQEFDYHGSFTVQTGWQWRNAHGGTFRIGMQYYRGKSEQWSLADRSEDKIGLGVWYDF